MTNISLFDWARYKTFSYYFEHIGIYNCFLQVFIVIDLNYSKLTTYIKAAFLIIIIGT
jgi:hypothetical protein